HDDNPGRPPGRPRRRRTGPRRPEGPPTGRLPRLAPRLTHRPAFLSNDRCYAGTQVSGEGEAVGDPGRLPGPLGGHGRLPVGPGTGAGGGGVAGGAGRDERRVADVDVEEVGGVT